MSKKFPESSGKDPFGENPVEDVKAKVNARADELMREGLYADQAEAQRAAWLERGDQ